MRETRQETFTLPHTRVVVTRTSTIIRSVEWNDKHAQLVVWLYVAERGTKENIQHSFTQPLTKKIPRFTSVTYPLFLHIKFATVDPSTTAPPLPNKRRELDKTKLEWSETGK